MNKKITRKSVLLLAASFSLAAFLFVNIHASLSVNKNLPARLMVEEKIEQKEDQGHKSGAANIALIGKVIKLVHRFMPSMY